MSKKTKLLKPKVDVVFQALFGEEGSERITKAFLEKILEIPITKIELNQNPIFRREKVNSKLGVLDVLAKINGNENCDIEMQVSEEKDIKERILFYWSKLYTRGIKKSEDYNVLDKSIVILISDKEIDGLEDLECHTEWKIIETKTRQKILTDKLEIHIIELEKLKKHQGEVSEGLVDWLVFLENPESERVMNKMRENKELKEAKEKLEKISEDGKMQQLAWWREKGVYEENGRRRREREIKEGEKRVREGEKRLEEGEKRLEEGEKRLEEGEKRLEEGEKRLEEKQKKLEEREKNLQEEKAIDIAKEMLHKGMPIELISEITKLPIEKLIKHLAL